MRTVKEMIERVILSYSTGLPYHPGKGRVVEALLRVSGVQDLHRGKTYIVRRQGLLWNLSPECSVQRSVYYHGTWEAQELRELKSRLRGDSVFVDIGSCFGYYSIVAAHSSNGKAQIYSFEPLSANFALLVQNLRLNGLTNVHPFKMALGGTTGEVDFEIPDATNRGTGRIVERGRARRPVEKVQVLTLDAFVEAQKLSKIDLLKVDVEGSELAVLQGGRDSILRFKPTMIVELNPPLLRDFGTTAADLLRTIADLGYRTYRATKRGLKPFDGGQSMFDYVNLLCVPEPRGVVGYRGVPRSGEQ